MIFRKRFLITAAFVCHLLLLPPLVTSQLHCPPPPSFVSKTEEATICAISQEKDGPVYKLHTRGKIHYRDRDLWADEATYNSETGDVTLEGHVLLEGGANSEHIEASRGSYNVQTEVGRFYRVVGTIGMKEHARRLLLVTSNPFAFTGKVVIKTGPDHYRVEDGTITTCEVPHPKWQFNAHRVTVEVGGNAVIYRSTFLLHGIPVLYFPFATHPVERLARQSGFLTPTVGRSSIKGTIFGDAFYWAIRRDMDATIGAEYFSKRGSAEHGEFRYRPTEQSFLDLTYFGVIDRGVPSAVTSSGPGGVPQVIEKVVSQGGEEVRLNAEDTFGHFRGVTNVDYLSSFAFRVVFNEIFNKAVFSEVKSQAFLSNTTQGYSYNAAVQRYQDFESTNNGDVITILHAPGFEFSSVDHQLGRSPLYWNLNAASEGLSRSEPSFRTAPLVGRFDFQPSISLPLHPDGWSILSEISLRDTFYSQQVVGQSTSSPSGVGTAVSDAINRRSVEGSVEIRPPVLERILNHKLFGHKAKHVIEPRVVYRRVTGINDFPSILRFDARDILTDTNEVEYGVINRLYTKRDAAPISGCNPEAGSSETSAPQSTPTWEDEDQPYQPPVDQNCQPGPGSREFLSWELAQKYFLDQDFGGALFSGRRNVFTTTADFSAIAFLTGPRHLSPLISRMRIQPGSHIDAQWDLDYDFQTGRVNGSTVLANYRVGQISFGAGHSYLHIAGPAIVTNGVTAPTQFNQLRLSMVYGAPTKRGFTGAASTGFDAHAGFIQYAAVQTTYNWDCCGVSLEYRRFALGSLRNENQYRFMFSLANIGSFGNLAKRERLY